MKKTVSLGSKVGPSASSKAVVCYGGGKVAVVSSGGGKVVVVSSGSKRGKTVAFETKNTSKAVYKDTCGGCSAKISNTQKAGGFVDKRSGNHGYKQEVNYKSSVKVNDKVQGCTTEYETQVKFKKTTTYHTPKQSSAAPKSSGYKSITYYEYR